MFTFIKNFIKKQKMKSMSPKKGSLKVGDVIIPIRNVGSHNYCLNKEYVVHEICGKKFRARNPINDEVGNYLQYDEVKLACTNREYMLRQVAELETELTDVRNKLAWMDEVGTDEFDETEYKVWSVMNAVDDKSMTKIERVKLIASLVKG